MRGPQTKQRKKGDETSYVSLGAGDDESRDFTFNGVGGCFAFEQQRRKIQVDSAKLPRRDSRQQAQKRKTNSKKKRRMKRMKMKVEKPRAG